MSDEPRVPAGTKADPLLVTSSYYKTCHHSYYAPQPIKGQVCRIVAYLDFGGRCPSCKEAKMQEKEGAR